MKVTKIIKPDTATALERPLMACRVAAGFPSPADDYVDEWLDLNKHLVRHPEATYFVRVEGDSMLDARIHSGDILVVDRAVEPADGMVVVAALDGELTVKRLRRRGGRASLVAGNPAFPPIPLDGDGAAEGVEIWGVVTFVIFNPSDL